MSEGEGSSSATSANAGFSPAQLAAIAGIVEKVLNKTLADRTGSTASGSSAEKGGAVDAGVRRSHPPVVGTSGDSSESTIGEDRTIHVMRAGVSRWLRGAWAARP